MLDEAVDIESGVLSLPYFDIVDLYRLGFLVGCIMSCILTFASYA